MNSFFNSGKTGRCTYMCYSITRISIAHHLVSLKWRLLSVSFPNKQASCPQHGEHAEVPVGFSTGVCDTVRVKDENVSLARLGSRKPPPLQPRSSHPPSTVNMDTYAVVNKMKPLSSPALAVHHYDNAKETSQMNPPDALYSTVKPKVRTPANLHPGTTSAYSKLAQSNQPATTTSLEPERSSHQLLSESRVQSKNSQFYTSLPKGPSDSHTSSDDDYEYVSNPVQSSSSVGSPGAMGFKCRIKKPKGPRDPPAQWNRLER